MKIASIQLDIVWQNRDENLRRAEQFIKQAKLDGNDLVVFPEMFNSGFSMNVELIAEPTDGITSQKLCELAKHYQINIIAGYAEIATVKAYNIAIIIDRTGVIKSKYIKNYPYSKAGELAAYNRGEQQVVFDVDGSKASMFICYDLRFPELFRIIAKQVDLIFVIANWPDTRHEHWTALLKARAIENQCFIIGVNRTGTDGIGLNYLGGSQVFSPMGCNLSKGKETDEYRTIELDLSEVEKFRAEFPFLSDMK